MPDPRASLQWLARLLVTLGVLVVGLWFKEDLEARAFHSGATQPLEVARSAGKSTDAAARQGPRQAWCPKTLESGEFGRIEIPRLGISALIAEGTQPEPLDHAVGHISTTAFPGHSGNCALAGHGDGLLLGLGGMQEHDLIHIDTLQGTYTYVVEWSAAVGSRQIDVLDPTATPSLTLVTCYPFASAGPAPECFIVRAKLVETTPGSAAIQDDAAFQTSGLTAEAR